MPSSFQEGRPFEDGKTDSGGRSTMCDPHRTLVFVKDSQRELGGLKHRLSVKSRRTKERRKCQARETLASFDRVYNLPKADHKNRDSTTQVEQGSLASNIAGPLSLDTP